MPKSNTAGADVEKPAICEITGFLVGTLSGAAVEVADFAGWGVDHAGVHDEFCAGSAEFFPLRIERVTGAGHWFPGRREC